jgi:Tfp pilus assembly protein PilF
MYLAAGDFQKTIETYKEVYQQNPKDAMVRNNYIKSLEAIKRSGDQAFERKDFALAGRSYGILRRNYPHFSDLNRSLSWRRKFLNDRIRNCRKILFENALEQYRSGNLSNATAIWKSILEFDPENAEVKKAVDTATMQLKNLEKMK